MSDVKIFWDPKGLELDTLGKKKYLRATDGDTPYVSMSIRMLSIDTPEVHYPGNQKPSKQDEKLAQLSDWIQAGEAPVSSGLAQHLYPKLATGTAGTLQESQGESATDKFKELLNEKLKRPSGTKRSVFLRAADIPFDRYGRLLAYMAPSYNSKELASMSRTERATFTLLMIESGWAASFPIYPSIPSFADLVMLRKNAIMYFNEDGFELEFNVKKTKEAYYGHIESINRFVAKMREKINILDAISLSH
jgi:endonuclease YncB( thermonuclease family)